MHSFKCTYYIFAACALIYIIIMPLGVAGWIKDCCLINIQLSCFLGD